MHRTLSLTTIAAASAALLLAGCSADATATSGESGGSGEPLIVYTNSNSDGRAEWLIAQAEEAGFDIEIVGAGGGDTTNKLIAEKNNPVADVVFGLNHMYYEQLKAEDAIIPYTPAWADEIDPELGDPADEKAYWPIVQQGIVLVYNADALGEGEAPEDWTELWNDERFHGRYESVTALGAATTHLVFAGILTRYEDEDGELGISEEGWAQIEAYFDNGSPAEAEVPLFARMADGRVDMGQMGSSSIPAFEEEYGFDAEVMIPEVGVPYAIEQVALTNGTEQQEEAQAFIDWFGSAETQAAWSAEFNSMPVNEGAIEAADPAIVEFHEGLPRQDIDWAFVTENNGAWIEKIELEYLG